MGLWIRLDKPEDLETRVSRDQPPTGEWCSLAEAIRIIREHNEREARREQKPEISITLSKWIHHPDGTHTIGRVSIKDLAGPGYDPTGEGSAWQPNAQTPMEWAKKPIALPSMPGSGPQLREAVQAIQESAAATPEPAPGSDADHPPLGYRLAKVCEKREPGYVWWDRYNNLWKPGSEEGTIVERTDNAVANPIPANEGDGRADDAETQRKFDLQWEAAKALEKERNELAAQVARLQEERDAALGRAALAEMARAELLADLSKMIQEGA